MFSTCIKIYQPVGVPSKRFLLGRNKNNNSLFSLNAEASSGRNEEDMENCVDENIHITSHLKVRKKEMKYEVCA